MEDLPCRGSSLLSVSILFLLLGSVLSQEDNSHLGLKSFVSASRDGMDIKDTFAKDVILNINDGKDTSMMCCYDKIPIQVSWKEMEHASGTDMSKVVALLMGLFPAHKDPHTMDDEIIPDIQFNLTALTNESAFQARYEGLPKESPNHFRRNSVLDCDLNQPFCTPQVTSVEVINVTHMGNESIMINDTIVVRFHSDTNTPEAGTKQAIELFLRPSIEMGSRYTGAWIDKKTLEITILEIAAAPLTQEAVELSEKLTFIIPFESVLLSQDVDFNFRIGQEGVYRMIVYSSDHTHVYAASTLLHIHSCSNDIILHSVNQRTDKTANLPVQPSYHMKGIASLTGKHGIVLPHSRLPNQLDGQWSLSFWLFFDKDPEQITCIFYKGPGHNHRTPSAWFIPQSHKLSIQVSSVATLELSSTSMQEIQSKRWNHFVFTFSNCSTNSTATSAYRESCLFGDERAWFYRIHFYLNGRLDSTHTIHSPVIPNEGPLYLGRDSWTAGVEGFIGAVKAFSRGLSATEVDHEYQRDKHRFILSESSSAGSDAKLMIPALGITKWRHNLNQGSDLYALKHDARNKLISYFDGGARLYTEAMELRKVCSKDTSRLFELFDAAAREGHMDAAYQAGLISLGIDSSPDECSKQEEVKDKSDSRILGLFVGSFDRSLVHVGTSAPRNLTLAQHYFENAAWKGHGPSYTALAMLSAAAESLMDEPTSSSDDGKVLAPRALLVNAKMDQPLSTLSSSSSRLALSLYHYGALAADPNAWAVLANKYYTGSSGLEKDLEAAAYYYILAAETASIYYHRKGKQPKHEMNKLSSATEDTIEEGQKGPEDELIQFQKLRADQGHVPSMMAMGDLYYWGARGMPRDHEQAFHYFYQAAETGEAAAQVAAAAMLLKGEGVQQNNVTALQLYEKAAAQGNTNALNGLGYIYFNGGVMEKNETKALEYFETAAALNKEGDSVFNAGHCYHHGLGTEANLTKAVEYYEMAARRFGQFDAVYTLGRMHYFGTGVDASAVKSLEYLKPASEIGEWAEKVRKAFDRYLNHDYQGATLLYFQASEFGYGIARNNLAYMYEKGYADSTHVMQVSSKGGGEEKQQLIQDRLRLKHLLDMAHDRDADAFVAIGDYYYYGKGGVPVDHDVAIWWYSRASEAGEAQGSYNVGYMHEYGLGVPINYPRARRYYQETIRLALQTEARFAIYMALLRLSLWEVLDGYGFFHLLHAQRANQSTAEAMQKPLPTVPAWPLLGSFSQVFVTGFWNGGGQGNGVYSEMWNVETALLIVCSISLAFVLCFRWIRRKWQPA